MSEPYMPTTEDVRKHLRSASHLVGRIPTQDVAMFDRWLAAHDREVAAKALRDAAGVYESGTWWHGDEPHAVRDWGVDEWLRDRADRIERRA